MEKRPPEWFSRYWNRYTWSRGLQDGFPGIGTGLLIGFSGTGNIWSRGLQDGFPGTETGIVGTEASRMVFQAL